MLHVARWPLSLSFSVRMNEDDDNRHTCDTTYWIGRSKHWHRSAIACGRNAVRGWHTHDVVAVVDDTGRNGKESSLWGRLWVCGVV